MAIANGPLVCATATWSPFAADPNWVLDTTADGLKTVTVCLEDAAGNQAAVSDTIELDTTPPTGTISLNGGDTWSTSPTAYWLTLSTYPLWVG